MSADNSVHDHLTNEEYNMASEVWYHAELVLKQCVEAGDDAGALDALDTLKEAVYRRFRPTSPTGSLPVHCWEFWAGSCILPAGMPGFPLLI